MKTRVSIRRTDKQKKMKIKDMKVGDFFTFMGDLYIRGRIDQEGDVETMLIKAGQYVGFDGDIYAFWQKDIEIFIGGRDGNDKGDM